MSLLDWLRGKKKTSLSVQSAGTHTPPSPQQTPEVNRLTSEDIDKLASEGDVEALIKALRSSDLFVRGRAVMKLGGLKDPRAVEPLIEVLRTDGDWGIRENTVQALSSIKDSRAVDPLIAALKDTHKDVRLNAALALGGFGDKKAIKPLEELVKRDSYVAWAAEKVINDLKAK